MLFGAGEHMYDWMTIIPPLMAIAVVLWKKEVILALLVAIFCSEFLILLNSPDSASGLSHFALSGIERIISVFQSEGNTRIIVFSLLVGALLAFMRFSGGVTATVNFLVEKGLSGNARRSRFLAFFTGVIIFIESNLSVLMAGILSRGLFDKFNMSRARLAYIIDSTSAPICILILMNAWGAFVLGLLGDYELNQSAVSILIQTIPLNFYALITIAIVLYTIIADKTHGPLKQSEIEQSKNQQHAELDVPASKAVLYATALACLVAYAMMTSSGRFNHKQMTGFAFKGMSELLPLVSIVLLSLALGSSLKLLGTGVFISGIVADNLPYFLIPAVIFITGALISFSTGTSWGTFAILIPIGMPLVINLGLPAPLILAAILGGGIWGDHCSPISDTTAVSAVASGCDLLEHVKTQLPYALTAGGLTVVAYVIAGLIMI